MPILPLKPIIIGTSIVVGASLAIYESSPQVRALIDSTTARLAVIFEEVFDAIDAQLRLLSPQQREERRRRQRERVRTAILFEASSGQARNDGSQAADPGTEMQTTDHGNSSDQAMVTRASGTELAESALSKPTMSGLSLLSDTDRKAKRRKLWEMSESPFQTPSSVPVHDSAVDVAEGSTQPSTNAPDIVNTHVGDAPPPYQPNDELHIVDDNVSEISSESSFEAINTPTTGSPSLPRSRAPSETPSGFRDEQAFGFSSATEGADHDDDDDASTETMSHVSGYSFASYSHHGSENQSETESLDNADVISIASSGSFSGDLNSTQDSR